MKQITFELRGSCGLPDGTTEVDSLPNHFRLLGGQIFSIQPVIEMASSIDTDDHRDLSYTEAVAFDLTLECDERMIELDNDTG